MKAYKCIQIHNNAHSWFISEIDSYELGPVRPIQVNQSNYIMIQLTFHVSVAGLPVLTIIYKLILMHYRTKSQNCEFYVL